MWWRGCERLDARQTIIQRPGQPVARLSHSMKTSCAEDVACEVKKNVNTRMHSEIEGHGPASV